MDDQHKAIRTKLLAIFADGLTLFQAADLSHSLSPEEYLALDETDSLRLDWTFSSENARFSEALHERYLAWLHEASLMAMSFSPAAAAELIDMRSTMESYITCNRFATPSKSAYGETTERVPGGFVTLYSAEWTTLRDRHTAVLDQVEAIDRLIEQRMNDGKGLLVRPVFRTRVKAVHENLVFMLMPFSEAWSHRIFRLTRETLGSLGYAVSRADELTGADVLEDVWEQILSAKYVVADVTGKNPNVYYEVGLCHVVGKRVILMTQHVDDIPFDLRRFRHLVYEDNLEGYEQLEAGLKRQLGFSDRLHVDFGNAE